MTEEEIKSLRANWRVVLCKAIAKKLNSNFDVYRSWKPGINVLAKTFDNLDGVLCEIGGGTYILIEVLDKEIQGYFSTSINIVSAEAEIKLSFSQEMGMDVIVNSTADSVGQAVLSLPPGGYQSWPSVP